MQIIKGKRLRTAIVPVRLRRADYQRAHEVAHVSAGLWNMVVEWLHPEWDAGRHPGSKEILSHFTSLPNKDRPLHAHTTEEIAYDLARALKTFQTNQRCGRDAKAPWRTKNYRPLTFTATFGWKASKGTLWLSFGRGRDRIYCWGHQHFDDHTSRVLNRYQSGYHHPDKVSTSRSPLESTSAWSALQGAVPPKPQGRGGPSP